MEELTTIQSKIYEIRGQRVMLDFDLAALYQVTTLCFYRTGSCDAFCGIAQWNGNTSKYLYYESICRHAQLYYDSYNRYFGIG